MKVYSEDSRHVIEMSTEAYVDAVLVQVKETLVEFVQDCEMKGLVLPEAEVLADILVSGVSFFGEEAETVGNMRGTGSG